MKTYKNLYPKICDFSNLLLAARQAQKGKRFQDIVARFNINLESELILLKKELNSKSYTPGAYHSFYIYEPRTRMISAAPYRDRVVHHSLCNIITPILEKSMIYDSYANRKGKGTHDAVKRYQYYAQKYPYGLKCDIKKFFPSIDHEILKLILRKKIACKDTLWLIDGIIDNSNPQENTLQYYEGDSLLTPIERKKGLPIGNLTSQWFGNFYLNEMDHFIKERLKCKAYVRYVDDFILLADSKEILAEWRHLITDYLKKVRMILHPQKTIIFRSIDGVPFLGHRIFPHYRKLNSDNVKRFLYHTLFQS